MEQSTLTFAHQKATEVSDHDLQLFSEPSIFDET